MSIVRIDKENSTLTHGGIGNVNVMVTGREKTSLSSDWGIVGAGSKPEPGKGVLAIDDIEIRIDPPTEWAQIYDESWRIYRDYFYATNYHGLDWDSIREKYSPFVPDLAC